ncbi:MAG: class I SAM-dependent methyltransferase [Kiritimatiellia bacterium]
MSTLAHADEALIHPDSKRRYNRDLFREVAPRYDLITRLLSFGRDSAWKRWMLRELPGRNPTAILDVACGTGDITRALHARYPDAQVVGLDLTPEMLDLARGLAPEGIEFLEADMNHTGRPDAGQDLITGGYALRNAPDISGALIEFHRMLRPGGQLALLDFSVPRNPLLRRVHYSLLLFWGGLWGLLLHGDPRVYAYIARSLAHFPDRESLHATLQENHLPVRSHKRFMLGMIEVLICERVGAALRDGQQ